MGNDRQAGVFKPVGRLAPLVGPIECRPLTSSWSLPFKGSCEPKSRNFSPSFSRW